MPSPKIASTLPSLRAASSAALSANASASMRGKKAYSIASCALAATTPTFRPSKAAAVSPVGAAFFATAKIWECLTPNPFMHTTTTGGNPLACAAALAHVDVMLDEDTPGQARDKGAYVMRRLNELKDLHPGILESVTGKGLLLGMNFVDGEIGYKVAAGLFARRVLTAGTLTNAQVIRFEPALTISYEQIDEVLNRLEDTFVSIKHTGSPASSSAVTP